MAKDPSSEQLKQFTRTLVNDGPTKARLYAGPALAEEAGLFKIIEMLWQNLQPVEPRPEFTTRLYMQLLREARRQRTIQKLGINQPPQRSTNTLIASAAALGAAATLAGVYAYWRWNSSRQAA